MFLCALATYRRDMGTRILATALLFSLLSVLGLPSASAEDTPPLPVRYGTAPGIAAQLATPGAAPPGANDFTCRPSTEHPDPVILLHGFGANMTLSWQTASPLLRNNGYCVFALDYGVLPRIDPTGTLVGLDYIENSSAQLATFVERVRTATGAAKVALVAWSEGGWLSRHYIQFDGGDRTVRTAVGLAADPALAERLNAGGGTSPHVHYTLIASRYDELVPPAAAFVPTGPHVTKVVLQDGCPIDFTDHLSIGSSRRALAFMLLALDPGHAATPPCVLSLPVL
jgi:pimeloyl-ACP methyl ester carboxylesterase